MSYEPTDHRPGSPEKIALLRQRIEELIAGNRKLLNTVADLPSIFVDGDNDQPLHQSHGTGPKAGRSPGVKWDWCNHDHKVYAHPFRSAVKAVEVVPTIATQAQPTIGELCESP